MPVPKYGIVAPFASALAQGQIASLFVRAYGSTQEPAYAVTARRAIEPLLSRRTTDLVSITSAGPILEEIPTHPRSHVLNGWISALWGILDVGLGLEDDHAGETYVRGIACLESLLDRYDTGWWTKYSLFPGRCPIWRNRSITASTPPSSMCSDALRRIPCSSTPPRGGHGYDTTVGRRGYSRKSRSSSSGTLGAVSSSELHQSQSSHDRPGHCRQRGRATDSVSDSPPPRP